jgi:hypothetical protein
MEVCIANLETATLIYPEKAKPIQNILQSWFPDIYLIVKPNRKEFNDEKQKKLEELSNLQNISPIKL